MTYQYERRVRANMDIAEVFDREMQVVRDKMRKLEAAASTKVLKEVAAMIENFGLVVDMKKSGISQYKVGSDSWGSDAFLVLTPKPGETPPTTEGVGMAVWDVTRKDPKSVREIAGGWQVQLTWGG